MSASCVAASSLGITNLEGRLCYESTVSELYRCLSFDTFVRDEHFYSHFLEANNQLSLAVKAERFGYFVAQAHVLESTA
jgi:hypothetical protein